MPSTKEKATGDGKKVPAAASSFDPRHDSSQPNGDWHQGFEHGILQNFHHKKQPCILRAPKTAKPHRRQVQDQCHGGQGHETCDLTSDPSESEGSRHPFGHDLMYQALETLGTNPCGGIPRHQPFSPGQLLNGAQDFQSIRWQFALRSLEGKALELLGHTAARAAPAAQKDGTKEEAQEIQGHDTIGSQGWQELQAQKLVVGHWDQKHFGNAQALDDDKVNRHRTKDHRLHHKLTLWLHG
mmetsp:Transcript_35776/g.73070  ORF Transcript_35776/g.73070 Transcript_35776/m.73070 type:complete len:240 (+) Transcript_35776:244-963(+)